MSSPGSSGRMGPQTGASHTGWSHGASGGRGRASRTGPAASTSLSSPGSSGRIRQDEGLDEEYVVVLSVSVGRRGARNPEGGKKHSSWMASSFWSRQKCTGELPAQVRSAVAEGPPPDRHCRRGTLAGGSPPQGCSGGGAGALPRGPDQGSPPPRCQGSEPSESKSVSGVPGPSSPSPGPSPAGRPPDGCEENQMATSLMSALWCLWPRSTARKRVS
mmetsp:Transcript_93510/g.273804  ORF Transcript_93510/g.273804 Transcript_93510/m.273804 type:complete len:217 (+) Transcript_93510:245-895(+)